MVRITMAFDNLKAPSCRLNLISRLVVGPIFMDTNIIELFCCLEFARVLSSDILSGGDLVRLLEHLVYVCMGWNVSPAKSISVVYMQFLMG